MLAKGSYGEIYRPPLKSGNPELDTKYVNEDYVMKIGRVQDDIRIAKILRNIDPEQKYFIYALPVGWWPGNSYIMKYGGIKLSTYVDNPKNKIPIKLAIKWYTKLVEALKLLRQHNIVMVDIKPDNIVVMNDDIHLIDFGETFVVPDNINDFYYHTTFPGSFYSILPLFISIKRLRPGDRKQQILNDEYQNYFKLPDFETSVKHLTTKLYDSYDEYVYNNIYKVDIWSLSNTFVFWMYILMRKEFDIENKELSLAFERLLADAIKLTPETQLSLDQVSDRLGDIELLDIVDNIVIDTKIRSIIKKFIV